MQGGKGERNTQILSSSPPCNHASKHQNLHFSIKLGDQAGDTGVERHGMTHSSHGVRFTV